VGENGPSKVRGGRAEPWQLHPAALEGQPMPSACPVEQMGTWRALGKPGAAGAGSHGAELHICRVPGLARPAVGGIVPLTWPFFSFQQERWSQ